MNFVKRTRKDLVLPLVCILLMSVSIALAVSPSYTYSYYNLKTNTNSQPLAVASLTAQEYNNTLLMQEEPVVTGNLNDTTVFYSTNTTRNSVLYVTVILGSKDSTTLGTTNPKGFVLLYDTTNHTVANTTIASSFGGAFLVAAIKVPPEPLAGTWSFRVFLKSLQGELFVSESYPLYVFNAKPVIEEFTLIQKRSWTYSIVGINISISDDSVLINTHVRFELYKPDGSLFASNETVLQIDNVTGFAVLTVKVDISDWQRGGWGFKYIVTDEDGAATPKGPFTYGIVAPIPYSPGVWSVVLLLVSVGIVYGIERYLK